MKKRQISIEHLLNQILYEACGAIFTLMVKLASKVNVKNAVEIVPVLSAPIVIREFVTR